MDNILGYSFLNWYFLALFGIVVGFLYIYSIELIIGYIQRVRYYNYLKLYRKFVPKKDKDKDWSFRYREEFKKQGKL